jgi:hypothetical protein
MVNDSASLLDPTLSLSRTLPWLYRARKAATGILVVLLACAAIAEQRDVDPTQPIDAHASPETTGTEDCRFPVLNLQPALDILVGHNRGR